MKISKKSRLVIAALRAEPYRLSIPGVQERQQVLFRLDMVKGGPGLGRVGMDAGVPDAEVVDDLHGALRVVGVAGQLGSGAG